MKHDFEVGDAVKSSLGSVGSVTDIILLTSGFAYLIDFEHGPELLWGSRITLVMSAKINKSSLMKALKEE